MGVDLGEDREIVGENMEELAEKAVRLLENGTRPEDFESAWYDATTPRPAK